VCDVLDAAGFDRILIETVGVGQSELAVSGMADSTVLVLVPESGDGIQALKSGVMEIADIFVVNKADRPGGDKLAREIEVTLGFRQGNAFRGIRSHHGLDLAAGRAPAKEPESPDRWKHPVLVTTASKAEGVDRLLAELDRHQAWMTQSGELGARRRRRLAARTRDVVDRAMHRWVWHSTQAEAMVNERLDEVAAGRISPYELAGEIVAAVREGVRV
jgi:LAO/AO transport system kinase